MTHDLTPVQALLLFGLLARHGECPQAELMPAIKADDRAALVKAKLIDVAKMGRVYHLALTDVGWAWAAGHLSAPLPPAHRTTSDLLARLGESMERLGQTLADMIGAKPKVEPQPAKDEPAAKPGRTRKASASRPARKASSTRGTGTQTPLSPTEAKKQIEAAYLAITGGERNRAVPLSRLAGEMPEVPRASLDAIFDRILRGTRGYSKMALMRHDDPRQLSQADHAAAYNPAGEPFHVLWIAS